MRSTAKCYSTDRGRILIFFGKERLSQYLVTERVNRLNLATERPPANRGDTIMEKLKHPRTKIHVLPRLHTFFCCQDLPRQTERSTPVTELEIYVEVGIGGRGCLIAQVKGGEDTRREAIEIGSQ